ncbi:MAG: hypothetical protein MI743_08245 [Sneathiellales bacterium]|nr:hypothetical protein [Sneathiellales bacterium]
MNNSDHQSFRQNRTCRSFDIAGREELKDDPRFENLTSRVAHSEEVYGLLAENVTRQS